jgi:Tol biopolymer transport system component
VFSFTSMDWVRPSWRTVKRKASGLAAAWLSLFSLLVIPAMAAPQNAMAAPQNALAAPPVCVFTPVHSGDAQPVISADGSTILYAAGVDVPGYGFAPQYFVYNRATRQSRLASQTYDGKTIPNNDDYTTRPAISDNGRLVSFLFNSSKGLTPNFSGSRIQIYARDMLLNSLEMVSRNASGAGSDYGGWKPSLSKDGRYVAFSSDARNLVAGDTDAYTDVYVRDRKLNTIERVSIATDGSSGTFSDEYGDSPTDISGDGRYVLFDSTGLKGDDGVVHDGVFLRDRVAARTYWIASGFYPVMTPDARFIAFVSNAALLPADHNQGSDLYLYDRGSAKFELLSAGPNGISNGGDMFYNYGIPDISADGSQVDFTSTNPNLVANDTNNTRDIFVRNRTLGVTERLTVNAQGQQANDTSYNPSISGDGRFIVFHTAATNLLPNDQGNLIVLCQRTPAAAFTGSVYLPVAVR